VTAIAKANLVSNETVGPAIHLLTLEAAEIARAARPGQFVMLKVAPGPDPLLARPFSVHGVTGDNLLLLFQARGKGTRLLASAEPGQELTMWGPQGRGFDLGQAQRPVLVAGGMGIAPLTFAIEHLCKNLDEIRLLYGLAGLVGHKGLVKLFENRLGSARVAIKYSTEDGSFGHKGLVTDLLEDSLSASQPLKPDLILACGPLPMLKAVARICGKQKVACQVSLEAPMACGVGSCQGCVQPLAGGGYLRVCQEGPVLKAEQVDWEQVS
jgi:dihydroorotate dehydrogenase electron transfer subunit